MRPAIYILILSAVLISCRTPTSSQPSESPESEISEQIVGGPCEGCEALFEYGQRVLSPVDTLPEFALSEPKLLLTGTVYQNDSRTPAEGVILYIYQTNRDGIYPKKGDEEGWARRHGYLRGWVRTDQDGHYAFYSFRPGSYPERTEPEHIHITIKEPDVSPYYIDEFVFEDDPLLTSSARESLDNRGGSGIVQPQWKGGILVANRDIILGKNIPGYN
jgi:protocatechuate 3,4-dioxygenase beta subunit